MQAVLDRSTVVRFMRQYKLSPEPFDVVEVINTESADERGYSICLAVSDAISVDLQQYAAESLAQFLNEQGFPVGAIWMMAFPAVD